MIKVTKEQLIARIEKQIDINATIIERLDDDSAAVSELAVEVATMDIQILDIAMAALTAPQLPQPAVPDERQMPNTLSMYAVDAVAAIAEVRGWNACRAAMLQGAEPISQPYTLPTQGSEVVNEAAWTLFNMLTEHGPLNGHQYNNLKDCFYEALKVAMRNTAAPQRELNESAGLACKCRSSEKVQVLQDGWVAVPVEATLDMVNAGAKAASDGFLIPGVFRAMLASAPDFREISNSSTKHFRENAETSTNCPRCSGRGSYHCPQMLGTVECECTLPAAPQQEASNRIQEERVNIQEEMAMGARLTKHRFKVK